MKNWKIYLDGVLYKEVELKTDFNSIPTGSHEIKIEAYDGSTLLDTEIRNIVVTESGIDPDYEEVLNATTAAGYALPSPAQQIIDNQIMIDLKDSGAYAKMDVFYKLKSTAPIGYRGICWVRKAAGTFFGSAGAVDDNQVKGNGSNFEFSTGYIPATHAVNYSLNNASVFFKITDRETNANAYDFGCFDSSSLSTTHRQKTETETTFSVNGMRRDVVHVAPVGSTLIHREDGLSIGLKSSAGDFTSANAPTGLPTLPFHIYNMNISAGSYYSPIGYSYFAIGASLLAYYDALDTICI